ncbi:hypothetical protein VTN02DRAFT_4791 [Thermoascus thermophilus]
MPGTSCSISFSMLIALAALFLGTAAARSVPFWPYKGPVVPRGELQPRPASDQIDRPLLSIQIGGIVGGYVIFVALVLGLLLFVGRRLRRVAQTSNYTLEMQMMTPLGKKSISTDPSPVTPVSKDLPSPGKTSGFSMSWSSLSKAHRSHASTNDSVAAIDESVVTSDRRRAQDEMEKLYAAVMEYDEQRAAGVYDAKNDEFSSPLKSPRDGPPEFGHLRCQNPPNAPEDLSHQQQEPVSRPAASSRSSSRLSRISNLSIFSPGFRSSSSMSSRLRSPRISIRKLPISPPIGSPDMANAASYGEEDQPLTPRHYNPGPPPPAPHAQSATATPRPAEARQTRAPAPAPLKIGNATNGSSTLPFRQVFSPPQSAPATKITILERPERPQYGPRTGMPTPYSPYMPFTPVTPITPSRMVTKQERKRKNKENGLRVLAEDDMVKSDEEMWGS